MMMTPTTSASKNNASRLSGLEHPALRWLLLAGSGALTAGFHQAWDLSLGLPGHFGLIWMAVVVLARAGAAERYAACIVTLGYAAGGGALNDLPLHALAHAPAYFAAAMVIDFAWACSPALLRRPLFAGLTGAFAFAAKPLVLAAMVAAFGLKAGSLKHGLGFPLLTHACFGATGAVLGALLWQGAQSWRRAPD